MDTDSPQGSILVRQQYYLVLPGLDLTEATSADEAWEQKRPHVPPLGNSH